VDGRASESEDGAPFMLPTMALVPLVVLASKGVVNVMVVEAGKDVEVREDVGCFSRFYEDETSAYSKLVSSTRAINKGVPIGKASHNALIANEAAFVTYFSSQLLHELEDDVPGYSSSAYGCRLSARRSRRDTIMRRLIVSTAQFHSLVILQAATTLAPSYPHSDAKFAICY